MTLFFSLSFWGGGELGAGFRPAGGEKTGSWNLDSMSCECFDGTEDRHLTLGYFIVVGSGFHKIY